MTLQNFIVLEVIDGAGTSTQLALLKARPEAAGFYFTAEPTAAPTGVFLRQMLKGAVGVTNETAAYLFAADRNEHVNGALVADGQALVTGIRHACEAGHVVVSDRYLFSSLAYQSIQCPPEVPRRLNEGFPLPALLVFLDISPEKALARISGRAHREIYEEQAFLERTVAAYRAVLDEYRSLPAGAGMKTLVLDATLPPGELHKIIWQEIAELPIKKG